MYCGNVYTLASFGVFLHSPASRAIQQEFGFALEDL